MSNYTVDNLLKQLRTWLKDIKLEQDVKNVEATLNNFSDLVVKRVSELEQRIKQLEEELENLKTKPRRRAN